MEAVVYPGSASPPEASGPDMFLVDEIVFYARQVYLHGDAGAAALMEEALAELIEEADTHYVDGMASLAAEKENPGYAVASREELLREILEYIAEPTHCDETLSAAYVDKLSTILGLSSHAREALIALSQRDCKAGKHAVALLLLVPPQRG